MTLQLQDGHSNRRVKKVCILKNTPSTLIQYVICKGTSPTLTLNTCFFLPSASQTHMHAYHRYRIDLPYGCTYLVFKNAQLC